MVVYIDFTLLCLIKILFKNLNTLCSRMVVFIVISCFLSSARYMRLLGKIVLGLLSTWTTTTRRRISTLLRHFKNIMHNEVLYILRFSLWQISPSRSKISLWPTTQRKLQLNTRALLLHFVSNHGNNLVLNLLLAFLWVSGKHSSCSFIDYNN